MNNFKKINFSQITDLTESAILKWVRIRRYRLLLFIIVVTLLLIFSNAPYINLFLNSYLIILISIALAPLVLNLSARLFFLTALILILPALLLSISPHQEEEAGVIGEYIFILLFSGVVKTFFSD